MDNSAQSFANDKVKVQYTMTQKKLLLFLIIGIFIAEIIAMIVIYYIAPKQYWVETLLDASIMIVLIFPILYLFHIRPLYAEVADRKRSEALLRKVLENLPVGVWIVDRSGQIIQGNQASLNIWSGAKYVGLDQYGEYKAWKLDTGVLLTPNDWAGAKAIQYGATNLDEELEIECFDGSHKIILNSATPFYDHDTLQGAIVVNQDITERKHYEQAIVRSNELIKKAFDSIDVLFAYMDREFNFIQVNEAYARSGGHPVEFFVGKNHFELYPHLENEAIFKRVVETGESYSAIEKPFEYPEYPERGITYWNWRVQPILEADKRVQGIILSLVDVTERKRAELLLESQNKDLLNLSIEEGKQRELAEGLLQSMLTLNASLELDDVLDSILVQVKRTIPYETANILLIENDCLRVVHHHGWENDTEQQDSTGKVFKSDDFPLITKMCSQQQPILVANIPGTSPLPTIPGIQRFSSYLAVPLILGERVSGIINLASHQPDSYNEELATRLMAFAAPASIAVENARFYAAELKARHLAETLNEASQALTQTLDLEKMMDTLLDFIFRLVPSDRAYILTSKDEANLMVQAIRGYEKENIPPELREMSYSLTQKPYLREVISTQKSLLIPDTRNYPGWETMINREVILSWLGIPFIIGKEAIGVLGLASSTPNFFTTEHIWLTEIIVTQASVAIQNAWLFEQVRAGHERFQSLSRRLVEVQESERRHLARALHDEASQALTALMFGLSLLEQEVNQPEAAIARLSDLKNLTEGVVEELHRLAMDLRPASLDYLGLREALEQMAKDVSQRTKLNVRFKLVGSNDEGLLPDHVETNIYRIAQEALTNAIRYAQAKNIDIILEIRDGKHLLLIEDDGIGFNVKDIPKSGHLGLLGMVERAQMVDGNLQVESSPGCGTTIVLEVPDVNTNLNRR